MAHILIAGHVQAAQISIEAGGAITIEGGGGSSEGGRIAALEAEVAALRGEHNTRLLALEAALAAPSMPPAIVSCVPNVGRITSCSASEEHTTAPGYYCDNAYDGQTADQNSGYDGGISWATNADGSVGQWINLVFDQPTTINTMEYANRDAHAPGGTAHATSVDLLFSDGTTTRVDGIATTGSSTHRFPAVVTTSVRVTVASATAGGYVGAEEITFSQTCP